MTRATPPTENRTMRIGSRDIGPSEPCFVIAEIGNNHNGDFDRAIALVDAAIGESGGLREIPDAKAR